MTAADYQREKDGYPDVRVCDLCNRILEPEDTELCAECEWYECDHPMETG